MWRRRWWWRKRRRREPDHAGGIMLETVVETDLLQIFPIRVSSFAVTLC